MTVLDSLVSRFDDVLVTDPTALAEAATDFGHLVVRPPLGVLRPRCTADVVEALAYAGPRRIPVAVHGGGHSLYGQGQAPGGIVIDMNTMNTVVAVEQDRAVVEAGASWRDVLAATLPYGLTPPVLTDYLGASVGGVLCAGGLGGGSHRHGLVADSVLELEVVTGTGEHLTCSPRRHRRLFHAVLAGLGQCAVIVRTTLRLVPAPELVRRHCLYYTDLDSYLADQRRLALHGQVLHLEGQARPSGGPDWRYMMEAVVPHTEAGPTDAGDFPDSLRHDRDAQEITDLTYAEFTDRVAREEAMLRVTGEWSRPHPWLNLLLPEQTVPAFVRRLLADDDFRDLRTNGLVLLYPLVADRLRAPLLRKPPGQLLYLFALLRTAPADNPRKAAQMVAANRRAYQQARTVGAVAYPINALPMTPDDWQAHYGPLWDSLVRAKSLHDPHGILTTGHGLWT
ncbi:FAD-binding protein [Streptomyces sp. NPDC057257]|uniref:FAD-binding protein n=1 Tax=Streptomyces sp. NPDC057257 TaxID=3346071 RepID=UPI003635D4E3